MIHKYPGHGMGRSDASRAIYLIKRGEQETSGGHGYPWPSLLELNDENQVWRKNGVDNGGGAMYLIDRDGTILSTSTDAEELEALIKAAIERE